MKARMQFSLLLLLLTFPAVQAFETVDEQIDHYLGILNSDDWNAKKTMLERLQWAVLSDPRMYDPIEQKLVREIDDSSLSDDDYRLLAYQIRALSFSGDERYRPTLKKIAKTNSDTNIKRHAKKAVRELPIYHRLIEQVANSQVEYEGYSVEVTNYMKMLGLPDAESKRFAARAIFHEKRTEPDLLEKAAQELKLLNSRYSISKNEDDAGAWLCKALGEANPSQYADLLGTIAATTTHTKIGKFCSKYAG